MKEFDTATALAKEELASLISRNMPDVQKKEFVDQLDLVPVRLYLPAGDSLAKTSIRRWFRNEARIRVGHVAASELAPDRAARSNLIILASRSSLPLVADFQETHARTLQLKLTERGISFRGKEYDDRIEPQKGTTLSRVIVTNWKTNFAVHTYIMSNHTRAVQATAEFLVGLSDQNTLLGQATDRLIADQKIPGKFQMAFEVTLSDHETNANVTQMLPSLNGQPLIYK